MHPVRKLQNKNENLSRQLTLVTFNVCTIRICQIPIRKGIVQVFKFYVIFIHARR